MYNYALSIYSETGEYTREVDTWLKKAAEKDHVVAMYELGLFAFEQGRMEDSKKWYAKAAERGHTTAMNNLANIYSKEGNEKEAIKFYLKAAEKSNPLALFNVGNYYEENKNIKLAKQYYSKVLYVLKEYPDILKEYSASDLETETMNRLLYLEKNFDEDAETE
jgi:tetratricopeptide repeat protein